MKLIIGKKHFEVKECYSFKEKLLGLMFKKNINEILCLKRCNAIHTFFMFEPIEVIMTDKNFNVLYVHKCLKRNRIILPKKNVYYTFEMKANFINCDVGEELNIKKE